MAKIKILKKLPKQNTEYKKKVSFKPVKTTTNKFTDDYLKFYDDIKVPSRRYDW